MPEGSSEESIMKMREEYVPRGVFNMVPIFVREASGVNIKDIEGKVYIDFAGGLGVLNVGHCPPKVVSAVKEQADRFLHCCFHVTMYDLYVQLAKKICQITPGEFPKKTMLVNSGAEAVENAVKVARCYTGRKGIVCFEYGFHGRTILALTLTSKVRPYKFGFGSMLPEVYRLPYAYCYRCSFGLEYPACGMHCLKYIQTFFKTHVDAEEVAALIVEPVVGEGGFIVPPPEFLPGLEMICRQKGIVFISDEVQSGLARTGKMFAVEHFRVEPDVITMAKSLAAGLPLGAVTGKKEIMDSPDVGGLGGTFSGNPLACAAALEVIAMMEDEEFLPRAEIIGKRLMERLQEMKEKYNLIGDLRGLGPMVAIELVKDPKTKIPAKEEAARVVIESYKRGLILIKAGVFDNVIRILVPLVVSDAMLDEGLRRLDQALGIVCLSSKP